MPYEHTLDVQQRAAAVAGVDGGIRLQEVVKGAGVYIAVLGRKNTRRHRVVEPKGVADGQQPLAYPQFVRIAERKVGQGLFGFNFQQGEVGFFICANQLGRDGFAFAIALIKGHTDNIRIGNHMIVGNNIAVSGDNKAGSQ